MEWTSADIEHKEFRTCWKGLDPREVRRFLDEIAGEIQRLLGENSSLKKDVQRLEKELGEHKDREKTIRNVLLNAHKTAEQMKANAEKEIKVLVAEAELKAEKILQEAHQRLAQIHEDIAELRRQRVMLETKLRSTLETYARLLDMQKEEEKDEDPVSKVKVLNR
ncbi:MAG: DivIVA domain-containing protein [Syntrophobacteraceae bacterium]|nr:DivIVA domain-containing protein [Syntrophobacteraceae bacterium]